MGWAAAVACNMAVLYGVYPLYKYSMVWSNDVNAFYLATSRFAWSLGLAWLTFACQNGYGGRYFLHFIFYTCTVLPKILFYLRNTTNKMSRRTCDNKTKIIRIP